MDLKARIELRPPCQVQAHSTPSRLPPARHNQLNEQNHKQMTSAHVQIGILYNTNTKKGMKLGTPLYPAVLSTRSWQSTTSYPEQGCLGCLGYLGASEDA